MVWNPHPEEGISSSMKLGLLEVIKEKPQAQSFSDCRKNNACLFLVADQPWIKCHTIEALIRMYTESEKSMAAAAKKRTAWKSLYFFRKILPGASDSDRRYRREKGDEEIHAGCGSSGGIR